MKDALETLGLWLRFGFGLYLMFSGGAFDTQFGVGLLIVYSIRWDQR